MRPKFAMRSLAPLALVLSGSLLLAAGNSRAPADPAPAPGGGQYIGVAKCKMCHSAEKAGDQHGHWTASPHAKAWTALASDEAKKLGTEKGIADPQKADECIKCHMTAFGVADDQLARGFKKDLGVQCESCHGPGEAHMKVRFAAAATAKEGELQVLPEGEIVTVVPAATCMGCHNEQSPSFKGFCYPAMTKVIAHLNPLKGRTQAQMDEMFKCPCGDDCVGLKGEACDKCNAGK